MDSVKTDKWTNGAAELRDGVTWELGDDKCAPMHAINNGVKKLSITDLADSDRWNSTTFGGAADNASGNEFRWNGGQTPDGAQPRRTEKNSHDPFDKLRGDVQDSASGTRMSPTQCRTTLDTLHTLLAPSIEESVGERNSVLGLEGLKSEADPKVIPLPRNGNSRSVVLHSGRTQGAYTTRTHLKGCTQAVDEDRLCFGRSSMFYQAVGQSLMPHNVSRLPLTPFYGPHTTSNLHRFTAPIVPASPPPTAPAPSLPPGLSPPDTPPPPPPGFATCDVPGAAPRLSVTDDAPSPLTILLDASLPHARTSVNAPPLMAPSSLNPCTSPGDSSDVLDPLADPVMGEPLHRWSTFPATSHTLPHTQLSLGDLLALPSQAIPVQPFAGPGQLDTPQLEVAATARPLVPWTGWHREEPMELGPGHPDMSMLTQAPLREMPQHPRVVHARDIEHAMHSQVMAMNSSTTQNHRPFTHQPIAQHTPWVADARVNMVARLEGEGGVSVECSTKSHEPASGNPSNHAACESINRNDSVAQDHEALKRGSPEALLSGLDNAIREPKVRFEESEHPKESGDVQVKAANPMTREDWVMTHRCIDRAYDSLSSIEKLDERLAMSTTLGDLRAQLQDDRETAVMQLEAILDPIDEGFVFRACASHKGKRLLGRVARVVRPTFVASLLTAIFNTPTVVAGVASAADDSTSVWCGLWEALAVNVDLTECDAADADLVAHLSLLKCGARLLQRVAHAQVDPLINTLCTPLPKLYASSSAGTPPPRLHSVAPQHLSSVDDLWRILGMLGEAANAEQKNRIRSLIGPFVRSVNFSHSVPTKN